VLDSETDLVREGAPDLPPIEAESLRVFPTDADRPNDALNATIDEHFVPQAQPSAPASGQFDEWKRQLLLELRRTPFNYFPRTIPAAVKLGDEAPLTERLASEEHIELRLRFARQPRDRETDVLLVVVGPQDDGGDVEWIAQAASPGTLVAYCEPRGVGATRWTVTNPANFVARSHALLGRTVDAGRVWDVIAASRYLSERFANKGQSTPRIRVAGRGAAAVLAAYAAALDEHLAGAVLAQPLASHMDDGAPQFLSVLRTCDVPDVLGLIAPRPLTLLQSPAAKFTAVERAYAAAGAKDSLEFK
jgi:hypothetical protein